MRIFRAAAYCVFMVASLLAMRALSAPLAPSARQARVRFVWADALWISSSPHPGRERIERVRVNTALIVHSEQGRWSEVSVASTGQRGFVPSGYLASRPLSAARADRLGAQAEASGQRARAISWAERALAVDGREPARFARLAALYRQAGRGEEARAVLARAAGEATIYVASCLRGEVHLLGAILDGARWVEPVALTDAHRQELRRAGWYRLAPADQRASVLTGTPFLSAGLGELQLAACDVEGAVYATEPVARSSRRAIRWEQAARLVQGAPGEVVSVRASLLPGDVVSAQLRLLESKAGFVEERRYWRVCDGSGQELLAAFIDPQEERPFQWLQLGAQGELLVALSSAGEAHRIPPLLLPKSKRGPRKVAQLQPREAALAKADMLR